MRILKWILTALGLGIAIIAVALLILSYQLRSFINGPRMHISRSPMETTRRFATNVPMIPPKPAASTRTNQHEQEQSSASNPSHTEDPKTYLDWRPLLHADIKDIDICSVTCAEMDNTTDRVFNYIRKNDFDTDKPPENDVAFQLAKLILQTLVGPPISKLLGFAGDMMDHPTLSGTLGAAKIVSYLKDVKTEFETRGFERARESMALAKRLKTESQICTTKNWPARCGQLNKEISDWIHEGALL